MQHGTLYSHQDHEKAKFYKNCVFRSLVGPSERGSRNFFTIVPMLKYFKQNLTKFIFLFITRSHFTMSCKKLDDPKFVQGVNFKILDSLKNNGTRYLLIFDKSSERVCISLASADFATASRHRGLRTIDIKTNLFHQSKLRRDVEFQNMPLVLFKSTRDVMQVSTLSAQFGLVPKLVDWYREATSVVYGYFLTDLLTRTDDRLRYCTNAGSIPSKF